jgi:hypothetical protein
MTERKTCPTPGRRGYQSRDAAIRRRPARRGTKPPITFPYLCPCGKWHLGTQREPQGPRPACPTPDKVGFATQDAAEKRAASISMLTGTEIRVYLCDPGCDWWHITSH